MAVSIDLKFLLVSASIALLPLSALAEDPEVPETPELPTADDYASEGLDPSIYMGNSVPTCGWPSVVAVYGGGGLCTGTLIHPRVVMYAAHCGGGNKEIFFAESIQGGGQTLNGSCQTNPSWNGQQGNDWAYCVLGQDVDLPISPVAYGCELDGFGNGSATTIIGFGNNLGQNGAGTKRWDTSVASAFSEGANRFDTGGGNQGTVCSGDSGGPAMIQIADGSWRTVGIASTKYDNTCSDAAGTHSYAPGALQWIEESSGIDVSVCHDLNGTWNPGPLCGNTFSGDAGGSYGSWGSWCASAPAVDWSTSCGPGFGGSEEANPPVLTITSPANGTNYPDEPSDVDIVIDVQDETNGGLEVQIEIIGMLQPQVLTSEPFAFEDVEFYEGTYELRAFGVDFWGNEGWSDTVTITVGDVPSGDDSGDGDGDNGDDSGEMGEDDSSDSSDNGDSSDEIGGSGLPFPLDDGGDTEGCACNASDDDQSPVAPLALGLGLLGLSVWRRRR